MKKKDFAKKVKDELSERGIDIPVAYAGTLVETVFDVLTDTLLEEKEHTINKFGKFSIKQMKAKKGRNPQTGKTIDIPAKDRLKFKPSATVKNLLN